MNSFRYCAYKDDTQDGYNSCSRSGTELPIEVNCAGLMSIDHPFVTHNERGREDFYLMYIIEGALVFNFDKSTVMGAVGDYVIFPPRYKYKYTNTEGTVSYYFAHFTGSYASQVLKELEIDGEPSIRHAGIPKATSDALSAMLAAWVREDRLAFSDDSPIGIDCEACGCMIKSGRFCNMCKDVMTKNFSNMYKQPEKKTQKVDPRDRARMRYLDN